MNTSIPKAALTAGVLLLLATGCSSTPQATDKASASTTSSASATATASSAPASAPASVAPAAQSTFTDFENRLAIESNRPVAAGGKLHVTGGTLEPGTGVKVYAAQMMAPPSHDAATGMDVQVGDEVKITDTVAAVADAKGRYELDLLIPAGTPPQMFNVIMISTDGRGSLVMGTIK